MIMPHVSLCFHYMSIMPYPHHHHMSNICSLHFDLALFLLLLHVYLMFIMQLLCIIHYINPSLLLYYFSLLFIQIIL